MWNSRRSKLSRGICGESGCQNSSGQISVSFREVCERIARGQLPLPPFLWLLIQPSKDFSVRSIFESHPSGFFRPTELRLGIKLWAVSGNFHACTLFRTDRVQKKPLKKPITTCLRREIAPSCLSSSDSPGVTDFVATVTWDIL
jgi:hypothetical protein